MGVRCGGGCRAGWSEVRDDERGGTTVQLLNMHMERKKTTEEINRANICFISIQMFEMDELVLSVGGDVSSTEKCNKTKK